MRNKQRSWMGSVLLTLFAGYVTQVANRIWVMTSVETLGYKSHGRARGRFG